MSEDEPETSFLNRWSSRKRDSATAVSTPDEQAGSASESFSMPLGTEPSAVTPLDTSLSSGVAEPQDAVGETLDSTEPDLDAEELLLSDADMPPIESLTADSNVSAFFNKGVSAALRKAALRFVFQQPKFNVRDGLNDYDGDYTVFEPLGDTITSDMKFHAARKERERLAAEAEREEELLRQEQLEADEADKAIQPEEEAEPAEKTEADDESVDKDSSANDDELSPETDEATHDDSPSETDSDNEPTTLALAGRDDGLPQQAAKPVESIEQV